ncbi:MAG TPA: alpha-galactosidase, partial [Candidatus Nitrosotenuis sp.]|nr:alpha-galactosidase [Candidatus Nitrosotenuis sp.]
MEALLELEGLALPARLSGSWRPLPGGLRLQGREVRILHPFGPTRFYRHGWQSWSPTGWVELGRPPQPVLPPQRRPQCDDPEYAESP